MSVRFVVPVLALMFTACAPHVVLAVPPATAPVVERERAYEQLKAESVHQTTFIHSAESRMSDSKFTDYLTLANGQRVYFPEDIEPVVAPNSPADVAARSSASKHSWAFGLAMGAIGALATGAVISALALSNREANGDIDMTLLFTGLGVGLGGGVLFGSAAKAFHSLAEADGETAFGAYNSALIEKLQICVRDHSVAECTH
jgi:hypothetical protein